VYPVYRYVCTVLVAQIDSQREKERERERDKTFLLIFRINVYTCTSKYLQLPALRTSTVVLVLLLCTTFYHCVLLYLHHMIMTYGIGVL
jgi:hypothetical protein